MLSRIVCTLTLLMLPTCGYGFGAFGGAALESHPPAPDAGKTAFRKEIVATGLESPWSLAFLPERAGRPAAAGVVGDILIAERPGRIRILRDGHLLEETVSGLPEISYAPDSQGGLMDLELHPDFARNRWIYASYVVGEPGAEQTQISRFKLMLQGEAYRFTNQEIIFEGFPGSKKRKHFGNRMVFGKDGGLFFTLGERGEGERAQDLQDLNGKTLRLLDDGGVPADNPFVGRNDARPEIYSYGNRNSQGLAVHPETGALWETEHGPSWNDAAGGGDEVNVIQPGKNYGWPRIHHRETAEGLEAPLLEWTPAIAPAGAAFYTGDAFPAWRNDFFFTNLRGEVLIRVDLDQDGRAVRGVESLLEGFARLRDVETGPDGMLYVLTSDTDAYGPGREGGDLLLRLVPE